MGILHGGSPELQPLLDAIGVPLGRGMRVVITIEPNDIVTANVEVVLNDLAGREVSEILKSFEMMERKPTNLPKD
jgi:hypothetical protein